MKKRFIILALVLVLMLAVAPALTPGAQAKDLDEILDYEITAEVNDDATVTLSYHIDWMVLDSTSEGPLSWVQIGIPNSHCLSCRGTSSAAAEITAPYGGSYARIDLDRDYEAGETAVIEFEIVQDYMYQVDLMAEGETAYVFTPGWFDDIRVDDFTLRWKTDNVTSQTPECIMDGGYLTWNRTLEKGEQFTVTIPRT